MRSAGLHAVLGTVQGVRVGAGPDGLQLGHLCFHRADMILMMLRIDGNPVVAVVQLDAFRFVDCVGLLPLYPYVRDHGQEQMPQVCVQPSVEDRVGDDAGHSNGMDSKEHHEIRGSVQKLCVVDQEV